MPSIDIAIAIILHPTDDSVLIAQRKPDVHLPNLWEFPGGKCIPGEPPQAAAVRESFEEVGLTVSPIEEWPTITHSYPDRTITLHPFLCRASSDAAEPLDNRQVIWVRRSKLNEYEFPAANRSLIDRLANS